MQRLKAVELTCHVQVRRLIGQTIRAVEIPGDGLDRLGATPALVCLPEFGQVYLLSDLLCVLGEVLPFIGVLELAHELHCSLESRVRRHLCQLLDGLRQHFVDLEQQESILPK